MVDLRRIWRRLRRRNSGGEDPAIAREIDEELDFHLEMRTRENLAAGMATQEARRRAARRLGELETVRRQGLAIRGSRDGDPARALLRLADDLRRDLGVAARGMRRAPGFTAIALLTLTVGIGASTAVFSVVNAVLLQGVPFERPDRLVSLMGLSISRDHVPAYRGGLDTLQGATFYDLRDHELVGPDGARSVESVAVDGAFFSLLGVRPARGRPLGPDDDAPGAPDVVLVSDRLWREAFGGDAGALGATLTIDGSPRVVVGVLPPGFRVVNYDTDVMLPLRDGDPAEGIGRLRDGVSFEQGRAEAEALAASFGMPEDRFRPLYYRSVFDVTVGGERPGILLLAGAVALMMLIACANVANLVLARALCRGTEIAMRTALGAGRGRLLRQLVAESSLLALCGGVLGVAAAFFLLPLLLASSTFAEAHVPIDGRVLGFALLLSAATGVVFGLTPAGLVRQASPRASMTGAAAAAGGRSGAFRLLPALVAGEIAIALVLLVGTGLLVRTFIALRPSDPGFDPSGKLTFRLRLPERRYPDAAARAQLYGRVLAELEALPGVDHAAATRTLPLIGSITRRRAVPQGGGPAAVDPPSVLLETVSANYHRVMDIAIVRGRALRDSSFGIPETVLSEEAARRLWPDADPLGRRVSISERDAERDFVVVGVASDITRLSYPSSEPLAWIRLSDNPDTGMSFVLRTRGPPEQLAAPLRRLFAGLDPELPVLNILTMDQIVHDSQRRERFYMSLMGTFGGVAILLAAIGLYGVMAYVVGGRTRELGVRVALGASGAQIRWMVVRQGATIIAIGIALGLAGCVAMSRTIESFLYGTSPTDLPTYTVLAAGVAAVALLACYIPARRATRIDPLTALRAQ